MTRKPESDAAAAARPVGEDDLTAWVDGELAPERAALVRQWLEAHPEAAATLARDREIGAKLKAALGPLGEGPLPARFRLARIEAAMRARRRARWHRALQAAAVLLLGVGIGFVGGRTVPIPATPGPASGAELRAALAAHRIFIAEKKHPVEVAASARDHLATWLGNRLGRPVVIPDLRPAGLTLVGGRLLPGPRGPAGQLMYETGQGARVTLWIEPGSGKASAFRFAEADGTAALAWRSPDMAFVLAGPLDRDTLTRAGHLIEAAFGPGG